MAGSSSSSHERHARVRELFLAACDQSAADRKSWLAAACGDDEELYREVDSLLAHHEATAELPAGLLFDPLLLTGTETESLAPGQRLGPYRLLSKIGAGGMGEVYEAAQERPIRRTVALKLIKWGMDTRQVMARFAAERQALALMEHPNIARVFDAGATTGGRPYFVMEHVDGVPVTEYCDRHRLTVEERLELFVDICRGVQHAHQKGVIHRDLKPSNVLVAMQDGAPVPKIIDFGVAKATAQRLTEQTLFTELGQWIGTPEYMSPEQADPARLDVDTRSDVYSLGVLLYELLVGARPFDFGDGERPGLDEMRRRITRQEPTRPSTRVSTPGEGSTKAAAARRSVPRALARQLRGDLDWITLRALEKDRDRRYPSVAELAADVARHLAGEAVLASPPSTLYRLGKFVRRHRAAVAAASLVVLALLLGTVAATAGLLRARQAEHQATREAETARQVAQFLIGLFQVADPGTARGEEVTAREILDRGSRRIEGELHQQPLVRARLLATMGAVYRGLGLYERATGLLESVLTIRDAQLAPDDPLIFDTLFDLGWVYYLAGDYARAAKIAERLFPLAERILDPRSPRSARLLTGGALLRRQHGQVEEAEALLRQALAVWQLHPDLAEPFIAYTHDELGDILLERGDLDGARAHLQAALEFRRRALGDDHPEVATSLTVLGELHEKDGDHRAAMPLYEEALALRERALGTDHPELVSTLHGIAGLHHQAGDLQRARPLFERAIAIAERSLGPSHPDLADLLSNYANVRIGLGEHDGIVELFERALEILERNGGSRHPSYPFVSFGLGAFYDSRGELDAARPYFTRALIARQQYRPPDDPDLGWTLYRLASIDARSGRITEAWRLYERARTVFEELWGPDHVAVAQVEKELRALAGPAADGEGGGDE